VIALPAPRFDDDLGFGACGDPWLEIATPVDRALNLFGCPDCGYSITLPGLDQTSPNKQVCDFPILVGRAETEPVAIG
jgi:hypothetical protein